MKVEGVTYEVNWKKFKKGYSFFIPCLNPKEAKKEILQVTKRLKFNVVTKVVVVDGIKGLRIWRT